MNGVVTALITFGPWIPNHHNSCIINTTTTYPGRPVMIFSTGFMIVVIISNNVKPNIEQI